MNTTTKQTFQMPKPLYMYDYEGRGIPPSKPARVRPMKHLPTCNCPVCKCKRETNRNND